MVNLNIGTFNVKGLANDKKRKEIFYWLKGKKMNIYFLQETEDRWVEQQYTIYHMPIHFNT
jgi:hypothetical protein